MTHTERFLAGVKSIADGLDVSQIDAMARVLAELRESDGRLFVIGVGGSAANASHAVNDFRKLCGIQAYAPTDNVAELTARTNDEGFGVVFCQYFKICRLSNRDAILVLSVGGGSEENNVSMNIVLGVAYANDVGAKVLGIVGRDGGYTKQHGDVVLVVPTFADDLVTPLTEAFQAVVWHALVSHPDLAIQKAKWEGMK